MPRGPDGVVGGGGIDEENKTLQGKPETKHAGNINACRIIEGRGQRGWKNGWWGGGLRIIWMAPTRQFEIPQPQTKMWEGRKAGSDHQSAFNIHPPRHRASDSLVHLPGNVRRCGMTVENCK